MADIRTLEAGRHRHCAAGGRVLLVGDHHQLPEVGAGGGFAYAAEHGRCVAELTVNRRQRHRGNRPPWPSCATGSVAAAVAAYLAHDRVVVTDDADAMIADAIDRWFAALDAGLSTGAAGRHQRSRRPAQPGRDRRPRRRRRSSRRRRRLRRRAATGSASGSRCAATAPEQHRRRRPVEVANGQLGTVAAVDDGGLTVRLDRRPDVDVVLDDRYLRRGGQLTHGYALTTHRAQGGTWDLAIAVGADGLYREGAYVELSRGTPRTGSCSPTPKLAHLTRRSRPRTSNATTPGIDPDERPRRRRGPHRAHRRSAPSSSPTASTPTSTSSTTSPAPSRSPTSRPTSPSPARRPGSPPSTTASTAPTARRPARRRRAHRPPRRRRRASQALDRHNVGTVTALDDHRGTASRRSSPPTGRSAERNVRVGAARHHRPRRHRSATCPRPPKPPSTASAPGSTQRLSRMVGDRRRARLLPRRSRTDRPGHPPTRRRPHPTTSPAPNPTGSTSSSDHRPADPVGADHLGQPRRRHRPLALPPPHRRRPGLGTATRRHRSRRAVAATCNVRLATTRAGSSAPTVTNRHGRPRAAAAELIARRQHPRSDPRQPRPPTPDPSSTPSAPDNSPSPTSTRSSRRHRTTRRPQALDPRTLAPRRRVRRSHHHPHRTAWGPDRQHSSATSTTRSATDLRRRQIAADEPWLQAALCAIDAADDTPLTDDQIAWLNDVADHRPPTASPPATRSARSPPTAPSSHASTPSSATSTAPAPSPTSNTNPNCSASRSEPARPARRRRRRAGAHSWRGPTRTSRR